MLSEFVALDFETADSCRDSACAIALVKVRDGVVVDRLVSLLRPPRRQFQCTWVHGISWKDVADKPTFGEFWPLIREFLAGSTFLAAHNATFDRSVLTTCCTAANFEAPDLPFFCTVKLSRQTWDLPSHRLDSVCRHLDIPLQHHDAGSDAHACARIVLAAQAHWLPGPLPWKALGQPRQSARVRQSGQACQPSQPGWPSRPSRSRQIR